MGRSMEITIQMMREKIERQNALRYSSNGGGCRGERAIEYEG